MARPRELERRLTAAYRELLNAEGWNLDVIDAVITTEWLKEQPKSFRLQRVKRHPPATPRKPGRFTFQPLERRNTETHPH
jgi:hypothetical protein